MPEKSNKKGKSPRKHNLKKIIIATVLLLAAAYFIYVMVWQQTMINQKQKEIEVLEQNIAEATAQSEELKQQIESLSDPDYIERFAREELGLVFPNERVFVDSNKSGE